MQADNTVSASHHDRGAPRHGALVFFGGGASRSSKPACSKMRVGLGRIPHARRLACGLERASEAAVNQEAMMILNDFLSLLPKLSVTLA
jgi:hypothetical protein